MTVQQHKGSAPTFSLALSPSMPAVAALLLLAVPSILSLLLFQARFILPSLSVISLGAAGMVALLAWTTASRRDSKRITLWDLSGLYAFLGFATGTLSEPQHVMEFWSLHTGDHGVSQ